MREKPAIVLILIVAFGLRIVALDAHPLWWDEGITLTFSRLGLVENIALTNITQDVNPPVYRWAVGGFTALTGTSIFTTRLVNVYAGVVAVAAGASIACRLFDARVGWLAAALMAFAPMALYYAQEAKGYTFVTTALLLAAWLGMRLHRWLFEPDKTPPPFFAYIPMALVIFCAMGAHYFAALGVFTLNLLALLVTWPAHQRHGWFRHWAYWLGAQALGSALLLPFVVPTLLTSARFDNPTPEASTELLGQLWVFFRTLAAGLYTAGGAATTLTVIVLALALIGLLARRGDRVAWGVAAWVLVPLLLGIVFNLRYPWFFERLPRFLLYTQPALSILAALGVVALARRLHHAALPAALLTLATLSAPLIALIYNQPTVAEDPDWPPLYATLNRHVQPGDVVLMSTVWMPGYMYAYVPPANTPPWELAFFDDETMGAELQPLLANYDRLWQMDYLTDPLVTPTNTLQWMRGRAAVPFSQTSGVGTLTLYDPAPEVELTSRTTFASGIELAWAPVTGAAAPGDSLVVPLAWQTQTPIEAAYVRFLHVVDADGRLVAQTDREPALGGAPTYTWQPGEPVSDPAGAMLPFDAAPGTYHLRVGLYDRDTLERLPAGEQPYVHVGTVTIP